MSDLHEAAQEQELVIRETVALMRETAKLVAGGRAENAWWIGVAVNDLRFQADKLERVCGLGENAEVKR